MKSAWMKRMAAILLVAIGGWFWLCRKQPTPGAFPALPATAAAKTSADGASERVPASDGGERPQRHPRAHPRSRGEAARGRAAAGGGGKPELPDQLPRETRLAVGTLASHSFS